MRVIIEDTFDALSLWVARYIAKRILEFKPSETRPFVIGLPTGSSPMGTYGELIKMHKNGVLSFKHVVTFNMDEYVGIPKTHPESYHSFMWKNFFQHIDVKPENVHILDGEAKDLQAECEQFEKKIKEYGGIELFLGGVGTDGHIAFNEPGSSLTSRTRVKTLAYETVASNARFFGGDISKVPKMALTVGVGTVMDAKEVVVIVSGFNKAQALATAIEEGMNHMCTLSALQMHPKGMIVCDEDATNELRVRTVKYFKGLAKVHDDLLKYKSESGSVIPGYSTSISEMKKAVMTPTPGTKRSKDVMTGTEKAEDEEDTSKRAKN
eukprot:CAMPEP_0114488348 /NCGR_PEP_ID=MMETSP0109-20121206/1278_1 /TAXON_ID=29199 /ORGANISM="Chlorarachnion reptans, Strain CCCM449" /LENGTH=322 /DNA_ID=CAMNT_0001664727 /DNA_START=108 /DNA_END=1076 /DNA_ORIENTATION=-